MIFCAVTFILSWFINDVSTVEVLYPWFGTDHRAKDGGKNFIWGRSEIQIMIAVRTIETAQNRWGQLKVGGEWNQIGKGKRVPLQAWSGPESSRKLRFPDLMTTAKDGGKVISLTHRPPLPPRKYIWYSFLLEAESTPGP